MDEAGATLPCMAPPQPTCTSQHPADGRHGTSVPGQGEGDSSLLPCCHRGRGRVLTPPAPNHRPAWPSHHRPGARRLAMGWAVPGAGGSSALRHNTAPQQEDLERDCTVQWDPTAGLCPVPLEARSQQPGGSPGWGMQGAPCHGRPHLVLGQLDLAALQVEAQQRGALQLLRGVGQPLQQLLQLVLELPQAQQSCLQLVLSEARAGSGTRPVGSKVSPAHVPSTMHPAPCTHTAAALTLCL